MFHAKRMATYADTREIPALISDTSTLVRPKTVAAVSMSLELSRVED